MYKLYEFKDDGPEDDPEGPAFIGPIPTFDIRTIRAENIPRADRLADLMSRCDAADAFLVWASETLGIFEAEQRVSRDFDLEALESARVEFDALINDVTGKPWAERRGLLRDALAPFVQQRLSFRQTATYLGVSLRVVVTIQAGSNVNDEERYADLEEALLNGELATRSARSLLVDYGSMDFNAFRRLCVLHDIDAKAAQRTRAVAA